MTPRTPLEVLQDQLDGVTSWQVEARAREVADGAVTDSREARMDAQRRLDALRRTHRALLDRADGDHVLTGLDVARPRAVLVHRNDWVLERLSQALTGCGLLVVAAARDGADALGIVVAEQPDLLFLEDRLPSVPTAAVLASVLVHARHTLVAVQVEHDEAAPAMFDAGAAAVFNRRVPTDVLAVQLAELLASAALVGG